MKTKKQQDKQGINQTTTSTVQQKRPFTPAPTKSDGMETAVPSKTSSSHWGLTTLAQQMRTLQGKVGNARASQVLQMQVVQRKTNNTGLPNNLKSGIESLSGYSLDDVQVHYNSDKPAKLQAHAYTQGTDIHIAPGQEKHLPHEAWHVVQQKQGKVQATIQMRGTININDDASLEKEADVMSQRAVQKNLISQLPSIYYNQAVSNNNDVYQLSIWRWVKKSVVSFFNFTAGSIFRVPKRLLNLAKHITVDFVRAIYFSFNAPNAHGGVGLMQEQSPMTNWAVGLFTKILDVANLREFIGLLTTILGTPLSQVRGLSDDEKALAREIFGDSMNLADISLLENSAIAAPFAGPGGAFTAAHTIHGDQPFSDPANAINNENRQSILMHELMHIAQEQKQGILAWIELQWGRNRTRNAPIPAGPGQIVNPDYNYGVIVAGTQFRDFSREQQGAIVQDYAKYLKHTPLAARNPLDMINGNYGSGQYQHYQAMLQGLSQGHWALPIQHPDWKRTIG